MATKLNSDSNAQKSYRVIIKCQGGFLTIVDCKDNSPLECLQRFQAKYVLTIEEQYEQTDTWFTVFTLKSGKVHIASSDIYKSFPIKYHWPKTEMNRIGKPVTEYDHKNKIFSHS
jgi:hypothetical protein